MDDKTTDADRVIAGWQETIREAEANKDGFVEIPRKRIVTTPTQAMNDKTLTAKANFLAKEARLDADAFRENTVYNGDGDAIRLIANAERLEQYADTIEALQSRIEALEAEKLKSLALQDLAYQNGAQQYAAIAAQSPEEAEKWLQNLSRRSDGLKVLNDAKRTLEGE